MKKPFSMGFVHSFARIKLTHDTHTHTQKHFHIMYTELLPFLRTIYYVYMCLNVENIPRSVERSHHMSSKLCGRKERKLSGQVFAERKRMYGFRMDEEYEHL